MHQTRTGHKRIQFFKCNILTTKIQPLPRLVPQGNRTEKKAFETTKGFKEDFKGLTHKNSELLPGSWSLHGKKNSARHARYCYLKGTQAKS